MLSDSMSSISKRPESIDGIMLIYGSAGRSPAFGVMSLLPWGRHGGVLKVNLDALMQ